VDQCGLELVGPELLLGESVLPHGFLPNADRGG
jgi:hypothetical protein